MTVKRVGRPALIGLTGTNGAGKGEIAAYLQTKGYACHSLSDILREELAARGLEAGRDNLIRIGNELRETFGADILARRTMDRVPGPTVHRQHPQPGRSGIPEDAGRVPARRRGRADRDPVRAGPGPGTRRVRRGRSRSSGGRKKSEMTGDETEQQLGRCHGHGRPAHRERRDDRGSAAESGGPAMTQRPRVQGRLLPRDRPGGRPAEHLLPAFHRRHHRPRRPDRLDRLRRGAAQNEGQPRPTVSASGTGSASPTDSATSSAGASMPSRTPSSTPPGPE